MTTFLSLKMSLRGVVAKLEETPSSQLRAFWRETLGAAATMSVPASTLVTRYLTAAPIRRPPKAEEQLVRFRIVEAINWIGNWNPAPLLRKNSDCFTLGRFGLAFCENFGRCLGKAWKVKLRLWATGLFVYGVAQISINEVSMSLGTFFLLPFFLPRFTESSFTLTYTTAL